MGVIYKITNIINKKVYIGQTRREFEKRKKQHLKSFEKKDSRTALINGVISHGVNNFIFEIIEECENEKLDEKEIFYINKYNSVAPNGYNIQLGGKRIYTKKINIQMEEQYINTQKMVNLLKNLKVHLKQKHIHRLILVLFLDVVIIKQ